MLGGEDRETGENSDGENRSNAFTANGERHIQFNRLQSENVNLQQNQSNTECSNIDNPIQTEQSLLKSNSEAQTKVNFTDGKNVNESQSQDSNDDSISQGRNFSSNSFTTVGVSHSIKCGSS